MKEGRGRKKERKKLRRVRSVGGGHSFIPGCPDQI